MSTSDSYIIQDASPDSSNDQDEVDSLPSSMDSSDLDSEEESDAQREWEASLQQLGNILGGSLRIGVSFFCIFYKRALTNSSYLQAGRSIWNGCIRSKSDLQIRLPSRLPELLKRRLRCDEDDYESVA